MLFLNSPFEYVFCNECHSEFGSKYSLKRHQNVKHNPDFKGFEINNKEEEIDNITHAEMVKALTHRATLIRRAEMLQKATIMELIRRDRAN